MHRYINPFHRPDYQGSKPIIESESEPIEYKGYLIFKRTEVHRKITDTFRSVHVDDVYDIVLHGNPAKCVAMMAGINGAKIRIDNNDLTL
jgi:hypothetical protein